MPVRVCTGCSGFPSEAPPAFGSRLAGSTRVIPKLSHTEIRDAHTRRNKTKRRGTCQPDADPAAANSRSSIPSLLAQDQHPTTTQSGVVAL
ncbi:hypothetical protein BX600DRAFT_473090 [Xylariales sp. PMI_506]|nr:hypothetical protein BX600DRAFT_473090 [Xylariales sp. PMI_506]